MISRRSLFGFLAAAPVGAVAAVKAVAEAAAIEPPMIGVGDPIVPPLNSYVGAINWVDPDYDERVGRVLAAMPAKLREEAIRANMAQTDLSAYWRR